MKKLNKEKIIEFIKKPKVYTFIFLIITVIAVSECMMRPGICIGADLDYHVTRIEEIAECIKMGDIKALTHPNLKGYGSGLFYPQVFLYIPAILIIIGLNSFTAYKIFLFLCSIATAYTMFFSLKQMTGKRRIGIIGSVLYTTCSYRMANLYWIAGLGIVQAFIFIPLVIYGMYDIVYRDYKKWYILAIGILGLLYSHLISFILAVLCICIPVVIFNISRFIKEKKRIRYMLYAIIIVILMSAFFIMPFLEQILNYDFYLNKRTPDTDLNMNIVKFPWNIIGIYDSIYAKSLEGYTFSKMGVGAAIFVLSTIYIIKKRKENQGFNKYIKLLYILATVYMFSIGIKYIWKNLGILNCIQFPWRLQLINSAIYCIISAIIIEYFLNKVKEYNKIYIYIIIVVVALFNILCNRLSIYKDINILYKLR